MFTGLVQTQGVVAAVRTDGHGGQTITLREPKMAPLLAIGESIAVNGACLTVVGFDTETFDFQAGPETLAKTTLGKLRNSQQVNLERALRAGDAVGGHFVSGHVDTVGRFESRVQNGEWQTVRFTLDRNFDELLVSKGSIAVDGVSLTLVDVAPGSFSVMLIPHTLQHTTLGQIEIGDLVNLEFDLLAKHVRKLVKGMNITL